MCSCVDWGVRYKLKLPPVLPQTNHSFGDVREMGGSKILVNCSQGMGSQLSGGFSDPRVLGEASWLCFVQCLSGWGSWSMTGAPGGYGNINK